jgi:hypothetical protein
VLDIREEESVRITWTAARDPDSGRPLDLDSSLRSLVFDGARSIDMPSVEIIYRFDANLITIIDASFYDAPHLYAGHA